MSRGTAVLGLMILTLTVSFLTLFLYSQFTLAPVIMPVVSFYKDFDSSTNNITIKLNVGTLTSNLNYTLGSFWLIDNGCNSPVGPDNCYADIGFTTPYNLTNINIGLITIPDAINSTLSFLKVKGDVLSYKFVTWKNVIETINVTDYVDWIWNETINVSNNVTGEIEFINITHYDKNITGWHLENVSYLVEVPLFTNLGSAKDLGKFRIYGTVLKDSAIDWKITLFGQQIDEWAWWNTTWQYRRPITINNTQNPNTLTNYQVAINLTYDTNMVSDFSDIRFTWINSTDDTEILIPYWIESKVNSAWAYVWVKVPYIPASSTATIYVYYGNTTPVNSLSSLNDVSFIYYNSFLSFSTTSTTDTLVASYSFSSTSPFYLRVLPSFLKVTTYTSGTSYSCYQHIYIDSGTTVFHNWIGNTNSACGTVPADYPSLPNILPSNSSEYGLNCLRVSTTSSRTISNSRNYTSYNYNTLFSGLSGVTVQTSPFASGTHTVYLYAKQDNSAQTCYITYWEIRFFKAFNPEPTTSIGAEEQAQNNNPPRFSNIITDCPSAYDGITKCWLNATWTDDNDTDGFNISLIEINYTGTFVNYTASRDGNTSYLNLVLPAGTFGYKFHANDSSNAFNSTPLNTFTIDKGPTKIDIYLNNTLNLNKYYFNNSIANITIIDNTTDNIPKTLKLFVNRTDFGSYQDIVVNKLQNITNVYCEGVEFNSGNDCYLNVTAVFEGNQNYTSSSSTQYIIIDFTSPKYSNLKFPVTQIYEGLGKVFNFNATWIDEGVGLDWVLLEINGKNYTPSRDGDVYHFSISGLDVGTHKWRWFAKDIGNSNTNSTPLFTFDLLRQEAGGGITLQQISTSFNITPQYFNFLISPNEKINGKFTILNTAPNQITLKIFCEDGGYNICKYISFTETSFSILPSQQKTIEFWSSPINLTFGEYRVNFKISGSNEFNLPIKIIITTPSQDVFSKIAGLFAWDIKLPRKFFWLTEIKGIWFLYLIVIVSIILFFVYLPYKLANRGRREKYE
jgi:hypothetical protein